MTEGVQSRVRCVLVSNRPWHAGLAADLELRTGALFTLITEPQALTEENLAQLDPRYVFFLHWSHRIEPAVFTRFECVIFHMTDLPFGRGGSPLQNLITRGFTETKITALKCVEELDAGPVYLKMPLCLHGSAEEIFLRAADVMLEMIAQILRTQPEPQAQSGAVTVFKRRTKDQGDLLAVNSLEEAFDLIRMLDAEGYPSAFIRVGSLQFEFSRVAKRVGHLDADVRITLIEASEKK